MVLLVYVLFVWVSEWYSCSHGNENIYSLTQSFIPSYTHFLTSSFLLFSCHFSFLRPHFLIVYSFPPCTSHLIHFHPHPPLLFFVLRFIFTYVFYITIFFLCLTLHLIFIYFSSFTSSLLDPLLTLPFSSTSSALSSFSAT